MLSIVFVLLLVCLVAGLIVDGIRSAPRQVIAATAAFSPPEVVLAWARTSFAAAARRYGYRLVFADDTQLVFEREWRPMAVWLVTLLLFPIGLIAYVKGRRSSPLVMAVNPDACGGSEIRMSGEVPARMARQLSAIADPP